MLKLGPHVMSGGVPNDWLALGVTVVKWHAAIPADGPRAGVLTIGRPAHYEGFSPNGTDATIAAGWYVNNVLDKAMFESPWIQFWESPNEPGWNDEWDALTKRGIMQWYAEYLSEFARLLQARGKRAVLGNWSVGQPSFDGWQYYGPVLEATRKYNAVLGRHSYAWLNESLGLRHRADQAEFSKLGYRNVPLVITECGAENTHGMKKWREEYANDFPRYFREWIAPFEREIRKDPYVLGATLYTVGTGGSNDWVKDDVSGTPIVEMLTELSREPWPPTSEPPRPPPTPQPVLTNQIVLNAVADVGRVTGKNLIGQMPHDLLQSMIRNRAARYAGPHPKDWGLTEQERSDVAKVLKL